MAKKRKTDRHLTKKRNKRKRPKGKRTGNKQKLKIQLHVSQDDWGNIQPNEIAVLLQDTAFYINRLLRVPFHEKIQVTPSQVDHPKVLYRSSTEEPYIVWLSVRDHFWCQFAYQFSHEFCHVLSNHQKIKENPNNWFHEAICELASVFALRCMSRRWRTHPAFPRRTDYAVSLRDYWQDRLDNQEAQLPEGMSLHNWISLRENELRENPVAEREQRNNQNLVAYELLPLFEETPRGWNAIRRLPNSSDKLAGYLVNWYSAVDTDDKAFVARIAAAFGYAIPFEEIEH
ncbi:MAG: hypothetical protein OXC79_08550 [Candidatus Poribacteria bacterium]|nr:hypothetical protein [Candidatus Poribacteria bacterium]